MRSWRVLSQSLFSRKVFLLICYSIKKISTKFAGLDVPMVETVAPDRHFMVQALGKLPSPVHGLLLFERVDQIEGGITVPIFDGLHGKRGGDMRLAGA